MQRWLKVIEQSPKIIDHTLQTIQRNQAPKLGERVSTPKHRSTEATTQHSIILVHLK